MNRQDKEILLLIIELNRDKYPNKKRRTSRNRKNEIKVIEHTVFLRKQTKSSKFRGNWI